MKKSKNLFRKKLTTKIFVPIKTMKKKNESFAIVGLGNPEEQYADSPHNAGFAAIDMLAERMNAKLARKQKALIGSVSFGRGTIILAKPETYMNKSGEAVKMIMKENNIPSSRLWVIHDDVDLPLGDIRIVQNRGAGGHKGVESVIRSVGTQNFARFRVGTRPKRMPANRTPKIMSVFVVKPLAKEEKKQFQKGITRCADAVALALEENVEKAMNSFN